MPESDHNILNWLGRPEELRAALEFTAAEIPIPTLLDT